MTERRITRTSSTLKTPTMQPTLRELFAKQNKTPILEDLSRKDAEQPAEASDSDSVQNGLTLPPTEDRLFIRIPPMKQRLEKSKPNKLYPIFNKPNPINATSDSSSQLPEIVDLCEEDLQPAILKVPEALIEPRAEARSAQIPDGHTAANPIVIDSSPVKPTVKRIFHKSFQLRNVGVKRRKATSQNDHLEAPFPDQTSQHVRGTQDIIITTYTSSIFERRTKSRLPLAAHESQFTLSTLDLNQPDDPSLPPKFDYSPRLEGSIPVEHVQQFPVIRHMMQFADSNLHETDKSQLWADKWRPRLAEHVLGNEFHALYLRDWLKALEVQYTSIPSKVDGSYRSLRETGGKSKSKVKRPRIRREVSKKGRKRQKIDEDGWIAYDDDDLTSESDVVDNGFDDDLYSLPDPQSDLNLLDGSSNSATPKPGSENGEQYKSFQYPKPDLRNLSNTIVLCGPSGCGKTAAVYACATELDWEVFEAYPGVGKRSGASLDSLVGQVGKNHLVMKTHHPGTSNDNKHTISTFFSKPPDINETVDASEPPKVEESLIMAEDNFGFMSHQSEENGKIRQSMILLEEADILYKDDVNFWPTVIKIIKDCRRPVILTCNDLSLIPVEDLPLQTVLYFSACPSPIAASYLQSLCLAEGKHFDVKKIAERHGLTDTCSLEPYLMSIRSRRYETDVRRRIHELQLHSVLDNQRVPRKDQVERREWDATLDFSAEWPVCEFDSEARDENLKYLRSVDRHMAMVSLVDCGLIAHVDEETVGFTNSDDDETGHRIIASELLTPTECVFKQHDISIAQALLTYSRKSLGQCSLIAQETDQFATGNVELEISRAHHRSEMRDVQKKLGSSHMMDSCVFIDYEPFVRQTIYYDNEQEVLQVQHRGRTTRNSQRAGHVRWIELEGHQTERMERTGYGKS